MAKITDPSKLLPSTKISSSIVRVGKSSIVPSVKFSAKSVALSTEVLKRKRVQEASDINGQLVRIGSFFKIDLENSKKEAEKKRKEKEKEDFSEAEKKLETPKMKGFKFPKMNFPAVGLLERIKRFLFFTAVGWLVPKLIELIPKLEGFLKLISGAYLFVEDIFNKLLDGFSSLVKFGGDLKNNAIGFLAKTKGGNYQKEFDKLESQFNNFVNLSIVAGLLGTDIALSGIGEWKKWKEKNREIGKPREPEAKKPGTKAAAKVTIGRGGEKGLGRKAGVTTGRGGKKTQLKGPFAKFTKILKRFGNVLIPGVGAVLGEMDARIRFKSGDNVGGWMARISAILDGFAASIGIAGLASSALALTGVGAVVPAALLTAASVAGTASMIIDGILFVRDLVKMFAPQIPMFSSGGRVVRKYQGGGNTRQSRAPRRTLKPAKRKPFKISPQRSQPGKDVGGKKEIEILYPDSKKKLTKEEWIKKNSPGSYDTYLRHYQKTVNKPNPYKSLTFASQSFKDLPAGLGHIVGAAIDSTLGQKVDIKRAVQQFSYGMSYLAENYANQRVSVSMSSLARDVNVFADGGYVPPSREMKKTNEMANFGEMLSRVLEPAINLKINEVIQNVKKEINKKGTKEDKEPEIAGPGVGGGIESIDISGMSAEDVDALGRMVQAESGGESELGKAAVLAVILNRYRLIRSGKVPPGEFTVANKPKDQITIRDIIFAKGQFSPMDNGSFDRTSSESGKTALAAAIRMGGNDPQKLRENLIRVGKLNEADADYILRSTFFSAPGSRVTVPGGRAREVLIGGHSFQQSGSSRLLGRIEAIDATVSQSTISTIKLDFKKLGLTVGERAGSMARGRPHNGRDIAIQEGTPLRAISDAVIVYSEFQGKGPGEGYGWTIIYREKNGREHLYGHMREKSKFKPGDIVSANTILGYVGSTGKSTGPHLHWEVANKPGEVGIKRTNIIDPLEIGYKATDPFGGGASIESPRQEQQPQRTRQQQRLEAQPKPRSSSQSSFSQSQLGILRALSKKNFIPFEYNGKRYVFKVFDNLNMAAWQSLPFNDSLPNPLFGRIESNTSEFKKLIPTIRDKIDSMYRLPSSGGKQKGGLIAPSTSRLPIPNSFASYEHPDSRMMIAIQPIIIEKTVPTSSSGNSPIAFPVLVGVNNNNLDSYRG